MKSWSTRPSASITLAMAMARAASVAGRSGSQYLALAAIQVRRGSTTTSSLPRFMASTIQCPKKPSGFDTMPSLPHTRMHSGST